MLFCRVDDFPGTKPEEFWRHNLDNFKRFDEVMRRHGAGYVLGVIPRYTTEEDLRFMGSQGFFEVALHGIYHDESHLNEFREHQTTKDIEMAIRSAAAPLVDNCGLVDIYIPPHNVIDRRTCSALDRAGFKTVMGGPGTERDVFDFAQKTFGTKTIFSHHPHEYGRSDELLLCGSVEHLSGPGDRVLTLHWTWEWNIGLDNLDRYLSALMPQVAYGRWDQQ